MKSRRKGKVREHFHSSLQFLCIIYFTFCYKFKGIVYIFITDIIKVFFLPQLKFYSVYNISVFVLFFLLHYILLIFIVYVW